MAAAVNTGFSRYSANYPVVAANFVVHYQRKSQNTKEKVMNEKSKTITRRDMLKNMVAGAGAVAVTTMMGVGVADAGVMAKAAVQYQDTPKGKDRCSTCANFIAPHSCKVVAGNISPNGWCIAFVPKSA
ncbi:iron oxidase [Acidithiobacillus ferrianus]|uniref:Iron oxidase n=1 Tax=Acidithiobacillus ferrianus TaxID=2678518 RepID=A0ACD5H5L0_9PROT|nr:iron oxidase [Acidithiobacillus ferrianus]